jgi:hypothetical protein
MTEAEWLACTSPQSMLAFVRDKARERQLRLFAAACFGRLTRLLPDARQRRGIAVLEQWADGDASRPAVRRMATEVRHAIPLVFFEGTPPGDDPHFIGLMLYREFCSRLVAEHAVTALAGLADAARERHEQARLMRDIFGPRPFRPVRLDPLCQSWNHATVPAIARHVYDDRAFHDLPLLADALEDAGCCDPDILAHCRGDGPHVRGCWVVDLLLGKD